MHRNLSILQILIFISLNSHVWIFIFHHCEWFFFQKKNPWAIFHQFFNYVTSKKLSVRIRGQGITKKKSWIISTAEGCLWIFWLTPNRCWSSRKQSLVFRRWIKKWNSSAYTRGSFLSLRHSNAFAKSSPEVSEMQLQIVVTESDSRRQIIGVKSSWDQ